MEAVADGEALEGPGHSLLRQQERLVRWQIASERMRFVLGLLLGLAGLTAAGLLAFMVWTASRADGLVVEPFSVPPSLAERGLTGGVVAGEVLDQLSRLNHETNVRGVVALANTWSGNSHVEIPETGVSIDEANRLLRRWLGRQTLVSGMLTASDAGVTLSARTAAGELVRAEGKVADLQPLARRVAEQLFAQARPVQYGQLLMQREQFPEAEAALQAVLRLSDSREELAKAHYTLGNLYQIQRDVRRARAQHLEAVQAGATYALMSLALMERAVGHAQAALDDCRGSPLNNPGGSAGSLRRDLRKVLYEANCALISGDYATAERGYRQLLPYYAQRGYTASQHENHIWALIQLHRTSDARGQFPAMLAAGAFQVRIPGFVTSLTARAAAQDEDWAGVLAALDPSRPPPIPGQLEAPTPDAWRALALAKLGRVAEAQAMASGLPGDCYRCLRTRAEVAEAAGDRAGADRWLAEAVRQNPKMAFAETDWARILLARGDPAGAIAKARAAHAKNPRFADPLEIWGEALLAKHDPHGAAAKFVEAATLAPRWGRLRLKAGEALAALGDRPRAQAQWRWAAEMDLTPAERTEVVRVTR